MSSLREHIAALRRGLAESDGLDGASVASTHLTQALIALRALPSVLSAEPNGSEGIAVRVKLVLAPGETDPGLETARALQLLIAVLQPHGYGLVDAGRSDGTSVRAKFAFLR